MIDLQADMKLEIEFAQSLQKLAQSHLAKRKGPEQPPVDSQQDMYVNLRACSVDAMSFTLLVLNR
jgi:hypothetical protein